MDTAQHKASTRSSLRSSSWPTERCARTPHCPCRVISRTASTSRGLGAADRGATARRTAPIGCCPIRAARPLRTSSTTYSASAARDEVDRCAAASSASRRAACPTATSPPRSGKYTSRVVALPHRASPPPCLATIRARSRRCSITFSWPDVGAPRSLKAPPLAACIGHLCCQLQKSCAPPVKCRQIPRPARAIRQSREGPSKWRAAPGPYPL